MFYCTDDTPDLNSYHIDLVVSFASPMIYILPYIEVLIYSSTYGLVCICIWTASPAGFPEETDLIEMK